MKITENSHPVLIIEDVPGLDPIRAVLENLRPGAGRIIIQCYDRAWTCYWGAMGAGTPIEKFFVQVDADYILGNMTCGTAHLQKAKVRNNEIAYLTKIIKAVQEALHHRAGFKAMAEAGDSDPLAEFQPGQWWIQELDHLCGGKTADGYQPTDPLDVRRAAGVAVKFATAVFAARGGAL